ncbi:MAG TPA: RIP metalloprotease RseP [Bacteroidia bacterium]|nr:RIP metalloprotease RseP [Bacteroidia bacterium]
MIKFTLFFLSLSFLIILHEFGHYITARWFKARVDKFYLFFDFLFPFGNIMKFSLFKKKIGKTEYGLGWFPFGGYVDIAGMMADPEKPDEPAQPDEFRAKKPWQRLIILAGGITVNFLLGIIIYSMMFWAWGEQYLPTTEAKFGVAVDSVLLDAGLRDGDKILSVDNKKIEKLSMVGMTLVIDNSKTVQVERDGQVMNITLKPGFDQRVVESEAKYLLEAQFPFVIDSLVGDGPALKAGFLKGDSLVTMNGDTLMYYRQFFQQFQRLKAKEVTIGVVRKSGEWKDIKVTLNENGQLGVFAKSESKYLNYKVEEYGFFAAWGRGWEKTIEVLSSYVKQLRLLFTAAGASKVGGFASIASTFPSEWDWQAFWGITAFISIVLAFMNLLPIPVLDGGYILFVLWEMVTGKKVSDKFMNRALSIGMYLVLALLILANGNDIYRFLIK